MSSKLPASSFYFECQGSGKCCVSRGDYGYVYLTKNDRESMARALGMSLPEFTKRHCSKEAEVYRLRSLKGTGACRFLNSENKCKVYEARPTQCRTWPFWPENMNSKVWTKEIASFCPGVGKGTGQVDPSSIEHQLKQQFESELEIFDPELYDVMDSESFAELLESIDQLHS